MSPWSVNEEALWVAGCRYGPFWVTTTLVFMTAVSSNIVNYWDHYKKDDEDKEWNSDLSKVGCPSEL